MESYIPISFLNDFIFCPRSIYFHQVHGSLSQSMYHAKPQIAGKVAHESIDKGTYTTSQNVLMGMDLYSDKYGLQGKIDIFFIDSGLLLERKNQISKIYDGYVFQVYAHFFALEELGYRVKEIKIHDRTHNQSYPISLPKDDPEMFAKFESTIEALKNFDLNDPNFNPNPEKCKNCIYSHLCDYSLC
ncbi:type V CRISPR-associated protein Cas4 [Leptospira ilyithenensis]|uniref:Type V CRISPR-associated protein Cas4 n=1 Tax=Leptospira ilyithenensis TaxID=2484901 RepID=A0A4R9LM27_9LEPT|nr:type V CRISPR-associated protein Cas4 [Leptospira ilyithenensis]TGN09368.1 type V CRISPR-associated protein Cas4 [Leptospira ilyithenensis]